ncbi:MAG TPA: pyridoxal-dependent decarboxylase [Cytophagales bacterium]|nr:pyridoxal-dependent decarboxylase [Cytophagales bacterium]HAA19556.1 pyridoxal-dependent decarboxylase [Cytophagales bacterium]HAP63188.1 pyridoxal-dependent decarboxylase [Cytophagales bacterium]
MKSNNLDFTPDEFRRLLGRNADLIERYFSNQEEKKAYHAFPQPEVAGWFDEPLPEYGMDPDEVLDLVKERVLETATNNVGPYMYAYVMAGGTQVSILAEQLAATVNQNVGKWHLAPAMTEMEKRVVQWGSDLVGYGESVAGVLLSGGSAANLAGLTVARNLFFAKHNIREKGLFGIPPFTVYASQEVHSCVDKSLQVLGIGTRQLRKIATDEHYRMDPDALRDQVEKDKHEGFTPFCIVGTAGTVNTGAIDPLDILADIAEQYGMWYHIDGAYGVLAAALEELKPYYKGLERANSLALDFHKWLYQPFEAGCLMVKDWETLNQAYFKQADYLDTSLEDQRRLDFNEHYFQLSRSAKALKIWMSLKTYGAARMRNMIQKDIDLTHYLAEKVQESPDFELIATSHLAIVGFRYTGGIFEEEKIERMNRRLVPALEDDGRIFITGTKLKGKFALRACLINHRMQTHTLDYMLYVIGDVAQYVSDVVEE